MPILVLKYPRLDYESFKIWLTTGSETVVVQEYDRVQVAPRHLKNRKIKDRRTEEKNEMWQTDAELEWSKKVKISVRRKRNTAHTYWGCAYRSGAVIEGWILFQQLQ